MAVQAQNNGNTPSGRAQAPAASAATQMEILVYGHVSDSIAQEFIQRGFTKDINDTGGFTVSLPQALRQGETVHAVALDDKLNPVPQTCIATGTVISDADWGRVRAYFAGGAVFSKSNSEFSKVDPTLTFALDSTWWQLNDVDPDPHAKAIDRNSKSSPINDDRKSSPMSDGHVHRPHSFRPRQVNTYFEARLTSVPTNVTSAASSAPSSSSPSPSSSNSSSSPSAPSAGTQATSAAGPTTASTGPTGTDLTTFLSSQKAAIVETGIYAPFYGDAQTWTFNGSRNALFVGPIVRGGILTAQIPVTGTTTSGTAAAPTDSDVFGFGAAGGIVGFQKLADSPNRAPELISFLHFTYGKWGNIREQNGNAVPWRFALEGRLKIPDSIFQVGFDANFGPGAGNDVRFIFGARLELGEVAAKLAASGLK
jgi:hypothetical protein